MDLDLAASLDGFSGAVSVSRGGEVLLELAEGYAHRAYGVPATTATRFAIASGSKGFTALTVAALIADGLLSYDLPVRRMLVDDLPLVAPDVTVEHLLTHTSGIGDYLDEEAGGDIDDYVLTLPVHELDNTEAFLPVLDGFPTAFPAGARFAYNNGGYVVLALLAERAAGRPFQELVHRSSERSFPCFRERRQVGPPKRADEPALVSRVARRRDLRQTAEQNAEGVLFYYCAT